MKLCLDTSAYSIIVRPLDPEFLEIRRFLQQAMENSEALFMPIVAYGELLAGFRDGTRERENRERLNRFLRESQVQLLDASLNTAEWYAILRSRLKSRGRMIPANDLWIAAHTAETGAKLLTFDSHFQNLPEIVVEIPEG